MNATAEVSTKGDNYISIVIEDVTEISSKYDIIGDRNIFTVKSDKLTIIGDEEKISRIEKWGNGTLKEIHC